MITPSLTFNSERGTLHCFAAAAIKRSLKETSPGVLRALETLTENLRATARETMPQPSRQVLAQGQIVSTRPMPVDRAGRRIRPAP